MPSQADRKCDVAVYTEMCPGQSQMVAGNGERLPKLTSKILIWVGGISLAIMLLAAGVGLTAVYLVNWNALRTNVEEVATDILDRNVQISSLSVDLGSTVNIRVQGVQIANPDWAKQGHVATVDDLRLGLRFWPLLKGQVVFTEVVATAPRIALIRDGEGRVNWEFGKAAEVTGEIVAPETRDEFPAIGRLRIVDGSLRYVDELTGVDLDGKISTATGDAEGQDQIELAINGTLEGQPYSIDFNGGSLVLLRDTEKPFPVDLVVSFADTHLTAGGTVIAPLELKGIELDVRAEGSTLAQLFPLLGVPLPQSPPYKLTGSLSRDGGIWRITQLDGKVGNSDLSGEALVDSERDPPFLKANLVSGRLDSADLSFFLVADSAGDKKIGSQLPGSNNDAGLFPKVPIAHDRLKTMDMDITFKGKRVIADGLPVDDLSTRIQLTDSRVLVKPLKLSVAEGDVAGELAFNARGNVPSADAGLTFDSLDLKPFFRDTNFVQEMGGLFSGHLYLLGEGESLDEIFASVGGTGWIAMRDGTISALLVEAVGLDAAEALVLVLDGDARVKIRCARIDVDVVDGKIDVSRAIIDTSDSILLAKGWVDLDSETLELQIEARPKDFSLIDLAAPVVISESIRDFSISIGGIDPLPFLELGQATDLNCARLLSGEISAAEVEAEN